MQTQQPLINIDRLELVEIPIDNTKKIKIGTIDPIRNMDVVSIEAFDFAVVKKSPLGVNVINANAAKSAYLVLSVKTDNQVNNMPLQSLIAAQNQGRVKTFSPREFDLTNSYIVFGDEASVVAGEVVLLAFYVKSKPGNNASRSGQSC
jgi:hypothetical protein